MPSLEELTQEQRDNLARMANQLLNDPKTSKDVKRLYRDINPKVHFPVLEQEDQLKAELKSRDEQIAELQQKQMQADARSALELKRAACRERGIDPAAVEKLIIERSQQGGMIDFESAMDLLEARAQIAAASPEAEYADARPPGMKDTIAEMMKSDDPSAIARKIAHDTITQLQANRRRI